MQDPTGRSFDLSLITNAPGGLLSRDYAGGTFTGTYRFGRTLDVGANYTLSRAKGNFDAENVASGPVPFDYRYPEYKQASWNFPDGDLAVDQRHRSRLWANYTPAFAPGLTLSVLQAIESGVPYGAVNTNGVDPRPYVINPVKELEYFRDYLSRVVDSFCSSSRRRNARAHALVAFVYVEVRESTEALMTGREAPVRISFRRRARPAFHRRVPALPRDCWL